MVVSIHSSGIFLIALYLTRNNLSLILFFQSKEILKVQVRNALLLLNGYEIAYLCEDNIKEKVLTLTKALKDDESKKPNEKMTRAERTAYQNEMMQRKLDMVNELTSLIPLYSDAVLSYLQSFQNFGICVESVRYFCIDILHKIIKQIF